MAKAVVSVSAAGGTQNHWLDQKFTAKAVAERKAFLTRHPTVSVQQANAMTPRGMIEYGAMVDDLAQQDAFMSAAEREHCVIVPPYVS